LVSLGVNLDGDVLFLFRLVCLVWLCRMGFAFDLVGLLNVTIGFSVNFLILLHFYLLHCSFLYVGCLYDNSKGWREEQYIERAICVFPLVIIPGWCLGLLKI